MVYTTSSIDTFYTADTSGQPLTYSIQSEESGDYTVIYTGKAYPAPGNMNVEIPITTICRNYLDNRLPDNWTGLTEYSNTNAVVHFQLTSGSTILEDYIIRYDNTQEPWSPNTASTEQVSDHINGDLAQGMYYLNTTISTSLSGMNTAISDEYTGGEVYIQANNGKYLHPDGNNMTWSDTPITFTIDGDFPNSFRLKTTDDQRYIYTTIGDDYVMNGNSAGTSDYYKWKYQDHAIISVGKSTSQDIYSISPILDNNKVIVDSMTLPITFVPLNNTACGRYALYYLQPNGGWSQYLFTSPLSRRNDKIERLELKKASRSINLSFGRTNYVNRITRRWELVTGHITDEESWKIASYLIPSKQVYIHDLCEGFIEPVVIVDTDSDFKSYRNQKHKKYSFTITVESSRERVIQ